MPPPSNPSARRRAFLRLRVPSVLALGCAAVAAQEPLLVDVTSERGVSFEHRLFDSGEKYMPENMGAGVAIFDFDGDGALDLFFVQGAPAGAGATPPAEASNQLLRQREDGTFEDVTVRAGVGHQGVGMGVAVGDFDDDGAPDLYITNSGPNVLYRNRGDGSFEDVTREAGVGGDTWSTGAVFADIDDDGDLDLYVAAYLEWSAERNLFCGNAQTGLRAYCHPDLYEGAADSLYLNEGGGRFRDVSATAGLVPAREARGLGVAALDHDGDGRLEVYVANDTTANQLYVAGNEGAVRDDALLAGVAVNGAGRGEASMGIAVGDTDGDGLAELFLTHLDEETNTLYRPLAPGIFADTTEAAGLAAPSLPWVGFGTRLLDVDLDGDLDLLIANGHIIDNIALFDSSLSHRQPFLLMRNDGTGHFAEERGGLGVTEPLVGRGLATGDLDRDGDQDVVVTQNGGSALVLDNKASSGDRTVTLTVREPGAANWGERWEESGNARRQVRWLERAPGYFSQSAPEIELVSMDGPLGVRRVPRRGQVRRHVLRPGSRYVFPNLP